MAFGRKRETQTPPQDTALTSAEPSRGTETHRQDVVQEWLRVANWLRLELVMVPRFLLLSRDWNGTFQHSTPGQNEYHIRVVSNSWGTDGDYDPNGAVAQLTDRLTYENGVAVIFCSIKFWWERWRVCRWSENERLR